MKRREFIKAASATWLGSYFSSPFFEAVAFAQKLSVQTPNLVVIRVNGAMDSLQGLNPWLSEAPPLSDLYVSYDPRVSATTKDYKSVLKAVGGTSINLGPSAQDLAPFASQMAIVNGIWMGPLDLGHPFALQYISSGRTQEKAPHITALVAKSRQSKTQFLVTNGPIQELDFQLRIMQTSNIISGFRSDSNDETTAALVNVYKNTPSALASYKALFESPQRLEKFNFVTKDILSRAPKVQSPNAATTDDEDSVVAALAAGLTSVAQIDFDQDSGGAIDNHFQYADLHPKNTKARFQRIARFVENLERYHLLNKTLVVVVTEFSRTPALNGNEGKDHNYFDNSALLIGYGVNGGTVAGGHRLFGTETSRDKSQLSGEFIDFASGEIFRTKETPQNTEVSQIPAGVDLIRPSNLMATVAEIILPGTTKLFGASTPVIPGIVKV